MSDTSTYHVYGLAGNDGLIRYIGRRKSTYDRLQKHVSEARRLDKTPCHKWVNELIDKGDIIREIILHADVDRVASYTLEKLEISNRGRASKGDGILINVTSGGQGSSGLPYSDDMRHAISIRMRGNKNGKATKGRNLGNSNAPRTPVSAMRLDGSIIDTFPSQSEAARHFGIPQSTVCISLRHSGSDRRRQDGFLQNTIGTCELLQGWRQTISG